MPMSETTLSVLIILAMATMIGWLYWADRRWPSPQRPRRVKETPAFCAHCRYRDGEDCAHPKSPAGSGPIGYVCSGRVKCKVREER